VNDWCQHLPRFPNRHFALPKHGYGVCHTIPYHTATCGVDIVRRLLSLFLGRCCICICMGADSSTLVGFFFLLNCKLEHKSNASFTLTHHHPPATRPDITPNDIWYIGILMNRSAGQGGTARRTRMEPSAYHRSLGAQMLCWCD
jgi:hypothetical protein